jgi:lipid A 3-O-deacylase
MRIRTTHVLALAAVLLAGPVQAQSRDPFVREIKFGILAHDIPAIWSGFRLENGIDVNVELILQPSVPFLGGHFRPAVGGTLNLHDSGSVRGTSKAYADIRWMYEATNGWFLGLGIGAALHDGVLDPIDPDRKALGRRVLFHFPLEIGYRYDAHNSIAVYFDHISNAYTKPSNEGLDTLGVRYGYKF